MVARTRPSLTLPKYPKTCAGYARSRTRVPLRGLAGFGSILWRVGLLAAVSNSARKRVEAIGETKAERMETCGGVAAE